MAKRFWREENPEVNVRDSRFEEAEEREFFESEGKHKIRGKRAIGFLATILIIPFLFVLVGIMNLNWLARDTEKVATQNTDRERFEKSLARLQKAIPGARLACEQPLQTKLPGALLPQIQVGSSWTINKEPREVVAPEFIGIWSGEVAQTESHNENYPTELTIWQGEINECIGTVEYPTLGCSGILFLMKATPLQLSVEGLITSDSGRCLERISIFLTTNEHRMLEYNVRVGNESASALLKKSQN